MVAMLYDLTNKLDLNRFLQRVEALKQKPCQVELLTKQRRTLKQNSYFYALLSEFAMNTGCTVEYVKEQYFKRKCNREIFFEIKQDKFLGQVEVTRSSASLTTAEMTTAIERFRNWSSSECGIYLPAPNEEEYLASIIAEAERYKNYL